MCSVSQLCLICINTEDSLKCEVKCPLLCDINASENFNGFIEIYHNRCVITFASHSQTGVPNIRPSGQNQPARGFNLAPLDEF